MSFLENLNKIEERLEKIKKVNENVSTTGKISLLELDLAKEHLRALYELYDKLTSLKSTNKSADDSKTEVVKRTETIKPVQEEKPKEEANNMVADEELKTITPELNNEKAAEIIMESKVEENSPKVEANKNIEEEEKDSSISLFEKEKDETDKTEVNVKSTATKPIKQLIGLNDKFNFIKVLFGNSVTKYDEAIAKIDAMDSKKEALNYFETSIWNGKDFEEKEELIERVEAILEAKFGS